MTAYTQAQLEQLRTMIARGVTSLEQNGEKVQFRSLSEMLQLERVMTDALGQTQSGGLHRPRFSRGT